MNTAFMGDRHGSFILALLRDLRIPVVTTLHTILQNPSADQRRVLQELSLLSARLVVMSERGSKMCVDLWRARREDRSHSARHSRHAIC